MDLAELIEPPPQEERHIIIEMLKLHMAQRGAELRAITVRLEEILRFAPDNDALRNATIQEFGDATIRMGRCVDNYVAVRDVQGFG